MRDIIHFAHGNGFPSPTYQQLIEGLRVNYEVNYIDRIGHHSDYPVTDNWYHLVDELIHSIETQADVPVIAVGHSLGGVLSFRAAAKRPELFKAVVLLDSPILGRFKSKLLKLSKTIGMIDKITPASQSKLRRTHWDTKEEALAYLKSKPLFKSFKEDCLKDYIKFGMRVESDGYHLRFDRQIEYQIYRTIPHMLYQSEDKHVIPCGLIYGRYSNIIDKHDIRNMKKNYNINHQIIDGTHMFPMEKPKTATKMINKMIKKLSTD